MKITKPSVEFFGEVPTDYDGTIKFIEMAGRTCYKSEDKITETSAEGFVKRLIKAGHLAMVEHSNFVIRIPQPDSVMFTFPDKLKQIAGKYLNVFEDDKYIYMGGNLTAWYQKITSEKFPGSLSKSFLNVYGDLFEIENTDDSLFAFEVCPHEEIPKKLHRYSAKFICDRGVSIEIVRHRPCSFAQESTRYVNYGGKDMEFVEPWWMGENFEANGDDPGRDIFMASCRISEINYNQMMDIAVYNSPQSCRAVLPNALKTEIVVTADATEWAHIRRLRTDKAAHPDMQRVMNMMPWGDFLN